MALSAVARARARRRHANDPHARETFFIELGAEGLRTWCSHVEARYPWRDFTRVTETQEFYLFVLPSGSGSALPKRLLNDAQESELRSCIREWSADHGGALAREIAPKPN